MFRKQNTSLSTLSKHQIDSMNTYYYTTDLSADENPCWETLYTCHKVPYQNILFQSGNIGPDIVIYMANDIIASVEICHILLNYNVWIILWLTRHKSLTFVYICKRQQINYPKETWFCHLIWSARRHGSDGSKKAAKFELRSANPTSTISPICLRSFCFVFAIISQIMNIEAYKMTDIEIAEANLCKCIVQL